MGTPEAGIGINFVPACESSPRPHGRSYTRQTPGGLPALRCAQKASRNPDSGQDDLVAGAEGDDRFLPVFVLAGLLGALAAEFAAHVEGVHSDHLDLEKFLDGLANLKLVGAPIRHDGVLVELGG